MKERNFHLEVLKLGATKAFHFFLAIYLAVRAIKLFFPNANLFYIDSSNLVIVVLIFGLIGLMNFNERQENLPVDKIGEK